MIADTLHPHVMIWTETRHITPPRSLGWIRRWKGDSDLYDDETVRAVLSECLSPLPLSVPILASLDPNCERFSFRVFWIRCAVTVNFTLFALNLRWVAWVILFHLRFLFIRLPSSRRCGLAETVGLCFRVDSDRVTLGLVLGLVCVCVVVCFVLFCCCFVCCRIDNSTVDTSLLTPWFIRRTGFWKTSLVLERPQESLDWIWYSYIWFRDRRRFWIWELRHYAWIERDEFWMMLYHLLLCFGRRFVFLWISFVCLRLSFDHECDLEPWTFFCGSSNTIGIRTWQWCEWMRCHVERGYGNLTPCGSTL